MTVALQKNRQEPCGNKLGRIGMGEVNNDWSNFILTAIQHYWNELALSVWPLAEQLFTKPRNSVTALAQLRHKPTWHQGSFLLAQGSSHILLQLSVLHLFGRNLRLSAIRTPG